MESNKAKYVTKQDQEQGAILLPQVPNLDQAIKLQAPKKRRNFLANYYGILFALISAFCLSMANVLVKRASFFNGTEMALLRYIIQLITMLLIGTCVKTTRLGPKEIRKILLLIGVFNTLTVLFLFFSIKFINPSEASALFQLNMVIIPIFARIYLKEKFIVVNLFSLIMAIVGVFFISQPSFLFKQKSSLVHMNHSDFNFTHNHSNFTLNKGHNKVLGISSGLLSAFLYAMMAVCMKQVASKKVHYTVTTIYQAYVGIPVSFTISLVFYFTGAQQRNMSLVQNVPNIIYQVLFAVGSGVFGVLFQIFLNVALKYEEASKVSMIGSTNLLFTFLFQFLILSINVDLFSTVGALMIFFATLLIIFFQMLAKIPVKSKSKKGANEEHVPFWKKVLLFKA